MYTSSSFKYFFIIFELYSGCYYYSSSSTNTFQIYSNATPVSLPSLSFVTCMVEMLETLSSQYGVIPLNRLRGLSYYISLIHAYSSQHRPYPFTPFSPSKKVRAHFFAPTSIILNGAYHHVCRNPVWQITLHLWEIIIQCLIDHIRNAFRYIF